MVSFTSVHRWNSLLCPPLGFLFNFTLLWLILHRTPKEMRVHSRILLQTCAMDCLLLASQCIGQIAFTLDRKTSCFVHFFDGYLVRQFKPLQDPLFLLYFFLVWGFLHSLNVLGTAVQFIYRYLVLNRNIKITVSRYFLLLFGMALCIFAIIILFLLGFIGTLNRQSIDRQRFGEFVDFEQQPLYVTEELKENILLLVSAGGSVLLITLAYSTICICGWKMVRFVRENVTLTGRLKELNRQLTKCLIILALIPLFIIFISAIIIIVDVFFGHNIQQGSADWTLEWELYFLLACHWLPVLNPLTTIYTNRPYRDALIGRFVKIAPTADVVA